MQDPGPSQALQEGAAGRCWLVLLRQSPELLFSLPTEGLCGCRSRPCTREISFQDLPFSFSPPWEVAAPFTWCAKDLFLSLL